MGRKPIGEQAMTAAERQRRRRERDEQLAKERAAGQERERRKNTEGRRRTREEISLDDFEHKFALLLSSYEFASDIDVASLAPERAKLAELQLRAAFRHLRALRTRLKSIS